MGRWRALGARTKAAPRMPARSALARACGPSTSSRSAVATGRCCRNWRWPGLTRPSTASRSPRRRSRSPAVAASRAPGGSRPMTGRACPPRTRRTTSPCSPTCSSTSRTRRHCCARRRGSPRGCCVEVPLEDNRSAARPAKRAEAARIGHLHALNRDDVRGWIDGAGLKVTGELSDPLPFAHHAFFAQDAVARAKAAVKWGVRTAAWKISPQGGERFFTVHYAVMAEHGPGPTPKWGPALHAEMRRGEHDGCVFEMRRVRLPVDRSRRDLGGCGARIRGRHADRPRARDRAERRRRPRRHGARPLPARARRRASSTAGSRAGRQPATSAPRSGTRTTSSRSRSCGATATGC